MYCAVFELPQIHVHQMDIFGSITHHECHIFKTLYKLKIVFFTRYAFKSTFENISRALCSVPLSCAPSSCLEKEKEKKNPLQSVESLLTQSNCC